MAAVTCAARRRSWRRTLGFLILATAVKPAMVDAAGFRVQSISNARVDVVIVAHADDWQVFMADALVDRMKSGRRPVFIYLTAGDHGRDSVYWRQREVAALASTRIALTSSSEAHPECATISVGAHAIRRCLLGSSVSFFLRLPDGNRNGGGFARNRFQSLRKLRANRLIGMEAVDSSTRYTSWQDLTATVNALVRMVADSSGVSEMVLHTTDPSVRVNPHDHYDHRIAGKLSEDLLRTHHWNGRYYIGYALATRAPNRTSVQRQEKLAVFTAYDREMMRVNSLWSAYRERPSFYALCMERTYARRAGERVFIGKR